MIINKGKKIKAIILGKLHSYDILNTIIKDVENLETKTSIRFPYIMEDNVYKYRAVTVTLNDLGFSSLSTNYSDDLLVVWGDGSSDIATSTFLEHTYSIKETDREAEGVFSSTFDIKITTRPGTVKQGVCLEQNTTVTSDFSIHTDNFIRK